MKHVEQAQMSVMLIGNHIKNAKAMCRQVKLDSNTVKE